MHYSAGKDCIQLHVLNGRTNPLILTSTCPSSLTVYYANYQYYYDRNVKTNIPLDEAIFWCWILRCVGYMWTQRLLSVLLETLFPLKIQRASVRQTELNVMTMDSTWTYLSSIPYFTLLSRRPPVGY